MSVTIEDIEALRRVLTELPRHQPRQVSKQEAIALLASELGTARRRGYTPDELARILSERGVSINTPTLRAYLRRKHKSRKAEKNKSAIDRRDRAVAPSSPSSTAAVTPATAVATARTLFPPKAPAENAISSARTAVGSQSGGAQIPKPPADSPVAINAQGSRK